MKTLLEYRN